MAALVHTRLATLDVYHECLLHPIHRQSLSSNDSEPPFLRIRSTSSVAFCQWIFSPVFTGRLLRDTSQSLVWDLSSILFGPTLECCRMMVARFHKCAPPCNIFALSNDMTFMVPWRSSPLYRSWLRALAKCVCPLSHVQFHPTSHKPYRSIPWLHQLWPRIGNATLWWCPVSITASPDCPWSL